MRRVLFIATVLTVALISQAAWAVPPGPGSGAEPGSPSGGDGGGVRGGTAPHLRDIAASEGLKTSRKPEITPAGAPGYLAWAHARSWNRPFSAFLRVNGEGRFRLNARRTQGWMGGIDPVKKEATFQQTNRRGTDSNIFLWNIEDEKKSRLPRPANTPRHWEYWPSNDGDHVLFGRLLRNGRRVVFLYERTTGDLTALMRGNVFPGQFNGNWATWYRCGRRACQVFVTSLTDIENEVRPDKVPNMNQKLQYAPSVDPDGNVYFFRSGFRCGANVRLMRSMQGGKPNFVEALPRGVDAFETFTYQDGGGDNHVLYDRVRCTRSLPADIHQIVHTP